MTTDATPGALRPNDGLGGCHPERATVGDTVECDVREPHQQTHRLTLETQEAADYATKLLRNPTSGWRRASGCYECAWGKVAGCWRCGSR